MYPLEELVNWPQVDELNITTQGRQRALEVTLVQSIASSLVTLAGSDNPDVSMNGEVDWLNNVPQGKQRAIYLSLLQSIAGSLQAIAQNGIGSGAPDYYASPGPPNLPPPAYQHIVVDSNGRQWQYFNNTWN